MDFKTTYDTDKFMLEFSEKYGKKISFRKRELLKKYMFVDGCQKCVISRWDKRTETVTLLCPTKKVDYNKNGINDRIIYATSITVNLKKL